MHRVLKKGVSNPGKISKDCGPSRTGKIRSNTEIFEFFVRFLANLDNISIKAVFVSSLVFVIVN